MNDKFPVISCFTCAVFLCVRLSNSELWTRLGRVVNVSSVKGINVTPFCAAYTMTKYAVEAFSDTLRLEMNRFGVTVSIVEPGNFGGATDGLNVGSVACFTNKLYYRNGTVMKPSHCMCCRQLFVTIPQSVLLWSRGFSVFFCICVFFVLLYFVLFAFLGFSLLL